MSPPDSPRPVAAPRPFDWLSPPTLADALAALTPGTLVKAGGVDVMDRLKEGLDAPARVLNLRAVPGLDGVRAEPDALEEPHAPLAEAPT